MKRTSLIGFVTIVMLAALALVAAAGPVASAPAAMPDSPSATLFSYQGQVSDAAGNPITNPALPMTFKLYTVATGGTPCWTEAHTGGNAVAVTRGLFNVLLGQIAALPTSCLTGNAYLELVVNGETLSPRELLTSVAFAVEANTLTAGATTRGDATIAGHLTASGGATFGPMPPGPYEGGEINLAAGTSGNQWRLDNYYGTLRFHHDDNVYFSMAPNGNMWSGGNLTVNGSAGIGTNSPGGSTRLSVVGGGISVGPYSNADAAIHISSSYGCCDRLLQMAPSGSSKPGLNLLASTNVDGNDQWWAWGVATENRFRIRFGYDLTGSDGLSIDAGGNVGIGTASPSEKLDVSGNINVSNDLTVGNRIHMRGSDLTIGPNDRGDEGRALVHYGGDVLVMNYVGDFAGGVRIDSNLDMGGHSISNCGALVEANLQTSEELASRRIDRFEEGDVLCWGIDQLELCSVANDRLVQAVADASGKPIIIGAEKVKVLGPVQRGDILVASAVPGYAMVNNEPRSGSVIAQALENFDGERGVIKAMIRKF